MAVSRNSGLILNSSRSVSRSTRPQLRRFAYISLIPVLTVLLLVLMFGMMGALPGLVEAQASIWYVVPNGTGAACSAISPCALQTAVSQAQSGDQIRVAQGTYTTTTPISLTQSISLTGGYLYLGGSNWSPDASLFNVTTLDGQNARRVLEIAANASPVIANFHIENGSANNGAGIYVAAGNSRPLITTNVIRSNTANGGKGGGGIYDGGAAIIENNEIYDNTTNGGSGGGGILVDNPTAVLSSTIRFNKIYGNLANGPTSQGGGVFVAGNGNALFIANYIHSNTAKVGGGIGAAIDTNITLFSNMLYDNEATGINVVTSLGGGLSTAGQAAIWNNTFVGNIADDGGAGIYLEGATAQISNNIVAFNEGNGNEGIDYSGSNPGFVTGGYNNVFEQTIDSALSLNNTIDADPLFVNLDSRNLHISAASPALNAGDTDTPAWVNIDIDQMARPNPNSGYTRQDIGADEFYEDFAAFIITPPLTNNFVERGAVETFSHTIENVGTEDDSYTITCASALFTVTYCTPQAVAVTAGSSAQITTSVQIPTNLTPYQEGLTTITASSQVSNTLSESALVRSSVAPRPGISFTPNYSRTELPGDVITLTHFITNTGDAVEDFIITEISDTYGWGELLPTDPY
ncbi:MAG: right-handed parallel beta-helix repeat-containing protein, partial [Chloroflexota bacterium]